MGLHVLLTIIGFIGWSLFQLVFGSKSQTYYNSGIQGPQSTFKRGGGGGG